MVATRHGISPGMREEIDTLLTMGWGAANVRNLLLQKYRNRTAQLALVPDRRQIENRKSYIKRHLAGGWDIQDFATFDAWASGRVCSTRERFLSVTDPTDPRMDDMIILDTFTTPADGETSASFGVVVTSRRVFTNVAKAVSDQGSELVCATDGTYNLYFGGWTLVDCGTETVVWSRNEYVHRFVPWVYMFVRSESTASYVKMFQSIRNRALEFLDTTVHVAYGSLDHSEVIASAFETVWPRIRLLNCYPHLVRQAKAKKMLLTDATKYDTLIKPHLKLLRSARSHLQFLRMGVIITQEWITCGERDYTHWFRTVYMAKRWERWHITASGISGVIPCQQGIEAHHGSIKRTCAPNRLASTSGVLSSILPHILASDGRDLCPPEVFLYGEGPIPPEMIMKANLLAGQRGNHKLTYTGRGRGRRIATVLFNSSRFMVGNGSTNPTPVTAQRAARFTASTDGVIADGIQVRELQFEVSSLHRVTITRDTLREPLEVSPVWSTTLVGRVRKYLKCTCHAYARTGWVCSHVLATLSLLRLLDLTVALSRVPVRRAPGRPPARGRALQRTDALEGYFSQARMLPKFLSKPGLPLKWRVVEDFDVEAEGDLQPAHFVGEVVSVRQNDGIFVWTARFDDGDLHDYDATELAAAVERAYQLGVDVTPP